MTREGRPYCPLPLALFHPLNNQNQFSMGMFFFFFKSIAKKYVTKKCFQTSRKYLTMNSSFLQKSHYLFHLKVKA